MNAQPKPVDQPLDVRVEPWPATKDEWHVPGRKTILVNGEKWGSIHMQRMGGRGVHYWFQQEGSFGALHEPTGGKRRDGSAMGAEARVYGDKQAARELDLNSWSKPSEWEKLKPLNDRLTDKARSLIERGLLVSPKIVEARAAKAEALQEKRRALAEQREQTKFEERALDAIAQALGGSVMAGDERDKLVAAIVEAMRWAQSK